MPNINLTTDSTMSVQMKEYYDKKLLVSATPELVHNQFGMKRSIPKNGGKTIEFRGTRPLIKALTPLEEGVTPEGNKLDWRNVKATLNQYGDYIMISDVLKFTAIDDNLKQASTDLGRQAGMTLDTLTREVLNSGTNVFYAGDATSRSGLTSGDKITATDIKNAVTFLKTFNAKKIDGDFVAVIHPEVASTLMEDPLWIDVAKYNPKNLYAGEIGKLYGVRFVETSEAKVWRKANIVSGITSYTVEKVDGQKIYVQEEISSGNVSSLTSGTKICVDGAYLTISSATAGSGGAGYLTVTGSIPSTVRSGSVITGSGLDVYSTLILGADAYGVVDLEGENLQTIIKQLGSAGSSDPLDQRATAGWKAMHTAAIITPEYMCRIESVVD